MLPTLVIVALVIVGFFVFVGARPDSFRLERSISINAVPEKVFALINDFHESSQWSPWDKIDPVLNAPAAARPAAWARFTNGPATTRSVPGAWKSRAPLRTPSWQRARRVRRVLPV